MAQIYRHNQEIKTIFALLGDKENDITFSLGWVLTQSQKLQKRLLTELFPKQKTGMVTRVDLQKHGGKHGGYTDIEITAEYAHLIIEAKRGVNLPARNQLEKYVPRIGKGGNRAIVVMAERESKYASKVLPKAVSSVPVFYWSWKQITKIARQCANSETNDVKRLLREFAAYMEGLMDMQNQKSNRIRST